MKLAKLPILNLSKRGNSHFLPGRFSKARSVVFALAFAVIGSLFLWATKAATPFTSTEPENAASTSIISPAVKVTNDPTASGGGYLQFGGSGGSGGGTTFQPTAPYYSTFVYPWYKNPTTDGSYSYWQDGSNPPNTWFSHYLPDIDTANFNPAAELYSSHDYNYFKWQMSKMAEAKQEVAISSWFGQGTKQDVAIKKYMTDFMARADNPYPNLRWSLYYECEGITSGVVPSCNEANANPTAEQIAADLTYIKNNIANSPYFQKINGKPVIFAYGQADLATTARWKQANALVGDYFYYVLQVYSGYASDPNQPSSWHQYGPAARSGTHSPHSSYVSPGFWLDQPAQPVRLSRDLGAFRSAVQAMAGLPLTGSGSATWRMTQTWNEWGEGTSVEPGTQSMINASGQEVADPAGAPFGNSYIQALADFLPALEQGTGR